TIREEMLEQCFKEHLERITLTETENEFFSAKVQVFKADWVKERLSAIAFLESKIAQLTVRLGKLTDAFIDDTIDKQIYEERKAAILIEIKSLEGKSVELKNG